jgi:hypothetical protein
MADFDAANARDLRLDAGRPRELVYAERMTACLASVYPDASEELKLATRAQHLCRWEIRRSDYAVGREGYAAWRLACRDHHALLANDIMRRHGYDEARCMQVARIIRKVDLKRDPEAQALENVAAVVFVQHYLNDFITDHGYDDDRVVAILKKTLRKMDGVGHAAVLELVMPSQVRRLVELAAS